MNEDASRMFTVLLVDDDEAGQHLMKQAFRLGWPGSRLCSVKDGGEAVSFFRERNGPGKADLILMDLNLPGKNGFEILEEIRTREHLRAIPAAVLTGSNAPADVEECTRRGYRYLHKPARFSELVSLVKSLQASYGAESPPAAPSERLQ